MLKEEYKWPQWGLNPHSSISMQLTVIMAYWNTLEIGGNVSGVY